MFPTFVELAGRAAPSGLDGVSLVPTLLGLPERQAQRDVFYWEAAPQQAIRVGDWKGVRTAQGRPLELYHLGRDVGEANNLAAQHPDIVTRLDALMRASRFDSPDFPLQRRERKQK
jgi:arylsulfatase A-like enzyme